MYLRALPALWLLALGCSQPFTVELRRELPAPSVSTPLVTASFIAVGHELGVTIVEPDGVSRCDFTTHHDVISAPKTDGKRIFFGSTNYIFYAIDSGCTEVWRFPTGDRIKSDPLVANDKVYLTSYDGHLYALEASSGRQLWTFPPLAKKKINPPSEPAPAKAKKAGGEKPAEPPPPVAAASEAFTVGDFSYSSPTLVRGVIYVGNLDHHLYAIDAETGAPRGRFKAAGPITSTPVADAGGAFLYFGANDNNIYALNLDTFTKRWSFATLDWVNSSARVTDDTLYIGSNDRHVYALDRLTGKVTWQFATRGPAIAMPALMDDLVICAGASGDGQVYALRRDTGAPFWQYATDGKIESDPVVVGETVYVSSADQTLYRFARRAIAP